MVYNIKFKIQSIINVPITFEKCVAFKEEVVVTLIESDYFGEYDEAPFLIRTTIHDDKSGAFEVFEEFFSSHSLKIMMLPCEYALFLELTKRQNERIN